MLQQTKSFKLTVFLNCKERGKNLGVEQRENLENNPFIKCVTPNHRERSSVVPEICRRADLGTVRKRIVCMPRHTETKAIF